MSYYNFKTGDKVIVDNPILGQHKEKGTVTGRLDPEDEHYQGRENEAYYLDFEDGTTHFGIYGKDLRLQCIKNWKKELGG